MRIIFVCQGNIIRSPLAENLFRHLVEEQGMGGNFQVESAGTSAYHVGEAPDRRMRQVARDKGFLYSGRSKQFRTEDFEQFDLIIAMDKDNQRYLQMKALSADQQSKIRMMRAYDPEGRADMDVPDPYYGGPDGFKNTFEIVKRSVEGLFKELLSGQDRS
jgi:protein-tyrosine phosphatase